MPDLNDAGQLGADKYSDPYRFTTDPSAGAGASSQSSILDGLGDNSKSANLGVGAGIVQLMQAQNLKKKADSAFPELYDPQQQAFLAEIGQKRKAMETGAEFSGGMNAIDASTAGTNNSIVQAGGGDVGGTIQGLLQAARVGQDSKNKVLANGQNQGLQYNSMYEGMLNDISGRKLQLQLMKSDQARAEWAQKQKEGFGNLMGGISHLNPMGGSGGGSGGGGGNPMDLLKKIGGDQAGGAAAAGSGASAATGGAAVGAGAGAGFLDTAMEVAPMLLV